MQNMKTNAYTLGFLHKIADYEKSALSDATKEERRDRWLEEDRKRSGAPNKKYKLPKRTALGKLSELPGDLRRNIGSILRGAASATTIAGIRGTQAAVNYAAWAPLLVDSYLFGKLIGVDEGRGVLGRLKGGIDRDIDRAVHKLRRTVSRYDEKRNNELIGAWNKFLTGGTADAVGNIAGFGGLQSIGKKGLAAWFDRAVAAGSGISTFTPLERSYQLRLREKIFDRLSEGNKGYYDPISTRANIENAPTLDEYKKYHLPTTDLPTSETGKIEIPYHWSHDAYENPLWFSTP